MEQRPKSIFEFNPGDIVTRVEPSVVINKKMFMGGMDYDSSHIGEKLVFIGIANGCAYFKPTDSFTYLLEDGGPISLELHKFAEGWAHYIDPDILIKAKPESKYKRMTTSQLIDQKGRAIDREDYEEANRIHHELKIRETK